MIVRLRAQAYASGWLPRHRVSKPVIVVGNLSVGGTGKTPLVIWLVERLCELGLRPGIVLRGYGARRRERGAVSRRVQIDSDPAAVGDEALLLRLRTGVPVLVDRDRVRAARALVNAGVNVIVADDGLQHLRLARNYEIVVIDAARGFGNGYLLPAGPLREPRARLSQVGAVVINGEGGVLLAADEAPVFSMHLRGERLYPLTAAAGAADRAHVGDSIALASLAGKRVHAMAGIGNPQRFFDQLSVAGLTVIAHPFPDHHRYRALELQFNDGLPVLMTEKDAVKCRAFAADHCWYLPVAAEFAPEQGSALLARLQERI